MSRKILIGGNWKCNGTKEVVKQLIEMLNASDIPSNCEVVVSPPSLHVGTVLSGVKPDVNVAVQNVWKEPKAGAWTGELTVDLIKDFGINWAVIGHSERRAYCHETPEIVGQKVKLAVDAGMSVIACIGEQLSDREAGNTMNVCKAQLDPILAAVSEAQIGQLVIAYEPVWAIGTGVTATPTQAQDTHHQIRVYLEEKIGDKAQSVRILYGGSVKGANCEELIKNPDIDGFLVGGASLKEEFKKIIASSAIKAKI